jgi:PadR family transcriptional regulator, regulatory protein PadR
MARRHLSYSTVTVLHAVASGVPYGFQIIDTTDLPSGTVYPALSRLERDGFVRSTWEDAGIAQVEKRPRRRYYRVTAHGERVLAESLRRFRALKPLRVLAPALPGSIRG